MTPAPRAAAVVALAALTGLANPVVGAVAILCAVVALIADTVIASRPIEVVRTVPPVLARGVPGTMEATVPAGATIRQPSTADLAVAARAGGEQPVMFSITAARRGRHVLPPAVVRVDGPLGLGRWAHRVGGATEIVVYPDVLTARRLAATARMGRAADATGSRLGPVGLGTAFETLRDYQPDDDLRLINWRATARLGRPITNQFRVEQSRNVVLAVDAGRLQLARTGGRARMDVAVDAACALAYSADAIGDRVGLVVFDAHVRGALPARHGGGRAVVEALVGVEPVAVDSDYELAFTTVGAKRSLVVVFTDLFDLAASRPLVQAVPVLSRRHQVLVVSAADEEVTGAATRVPDTLDQVFAAVAAGDLLAGRTEAAARLRRAGAAVVEARADRLPAACLEAYLTLKTRARV